MMQQYGQDLLKGLANAPWDVAARTFGNNHATLVGLLVHWWISGSPETRSALEGGPSFGYHKGGKGGGQCDAVFCQNGEAVGILEVEGTRAEYAADKIGYYFQAEYDDLKSLGFAILLLYVTGAKGRGQMRRLPPARDDKVLANVIEVSRNYPDKAVIVVTLDKIYERQVQGIRSRNEYYCGKPSAIRGILYERGQKTAEQTFRALA